MDRGDIGRIVAFARAVIQDADANVAVTGGNADGTLNYVDLTRAKRFARNDMAALINRYYVEQEGIQKPPALSES